MRYCILYIMLLFCIGAGAQDDRRFIREGNKFYRSKNYDKAEVMYRKAVARNKTNPQAWYNLGCALMMQEEDQDSVAISCFLKSDSLETNKLRRSMAYHNIGVIHQNRAVQFAKRNMTNECYQSYSKAIAAYKQSLRFNPKDDETRYNLALCQKMIPKGSTDGQGDQQQEKQEQQQDRQQQQQDKSQEKQEQEKQQPKEGMSKENAEQLLEAAQQQEQATQQRLQKAAMQQRPRKVEKNW